jgi:hypothetical protein
VAYTQYVLDVLLWLIGFSLLLWILLSLLAQRIVNPLGVFLGVVLAPVAFLVGVFVSGVLLGLLALAFPLLLVFVLPLALLTGFLFALFVLSALAGVGMGKALLALLLALIILTLLSVATWHAPVPPSLPRHLNFNPTFISWI